MKLLFAPLLTLLAASAPRPAHHLPAAPRPAAAPDSTTARVLYGAENPDLNELMGRVLSIEKNRLELHDRRLAGRRLRLTLQEYQQGVAGPEKELSTETSLTRLDSAGRLRCTFYTRRVADNKVEMKVILPRAIITKTFAAEPGRAADYSLRFDIHPYRRAASQAGATPTSPAQEIKLPLAGPALLAVYTLPYEHEGMYLYCSLAQSRVPVADWYARFRVPHFVALRARLE